MADKSNIGWTDASWNPVKGCDRVSPGCAHCYAYTLHDQRHGANERAAQIAVGLFDEGERHIRQDEGWGEYVERVGAPPEGWPARARTFDVKMPFPPTYDQPFSTVQLHADRLNLPLRWRKPRRIFVNSMSDLFHESVPDEFIDQVFARMRTARQHVFQILTKRPERMARYIGPPEGATSMRVRHLFPPDLPKHWYHADNWRWPLPNVHLGVSVENQRWADIRVPLLRQTSAAVRFISAEPLLDRVVLAEQWLRPMCAEPSHDAPWGCEDDDHPTTRLDWVIVGGESGAKRREMNLDWARSLRDQCLAAGVPYFFKQKSGPRPGMPSGDPDLDGCKEFPA